jgi:hypothetical protein
VKSDADPHRACNHTKGVMNGTIFIFFFFVPLLFQ